MENYETLINRYLDSHNNLKILSHFEKDGVLYVLLDDGSSSDPTESEIIIKIENGVLEENTLIGSLLEWGFKDYKLFSNNQ